MTAPSPAGRRPRGATKHTCTCEETALPTMDQLPYLRGAHAPTLQYARPGHVVLGRTEPQTCQFRGGTFWARLGVEG